METDAIPACRQAAYTILVSEIMLQQTQVSRVIPKYELWLRKFPTIESLAKASLRDVRRLGSSKSRFVDSDRYFRGRLIKLLTEKKSISARELHFELEEERQAKIIGSLIRDGLIRKTNNLLCLEE